MNPAFRLFFLNYFGYYNMYLYNQLCFISQGAYYIFLKDKNFLNKFLILLKLTSLVINVLFYASDGNVNSNPFQSIA